jgi:hypothetical protein
MKLKLVAQHFPRRLASLTLALAAIPSVAPSAPAPYSTPMIPTPGGWTQLDPNSPTARHAATFAATALGREFGHPYVVVRLKAAESQVVDGLNLRLRMRIAEVDDQILGARKECTVTIWSRPWLSKPDALTSFTCQAIDTGGWS